MASPKRASSFQRQSKVRRLWNRGTEWVNVLVWCILPKQVVQLTETATMISGIMMVASVEGVANSIAAATKAYVEVVARTIREHKIDVCLEFRLFDNGHAMLRTQVREIQGQSRVLLDDGVLSVRLRLFASILSQSTLLANAGTQPECLNFEWYSMISMVKHVQS